MSGRTEMAAHLTEVLPDDWRVIDHDTDVTLSGSAPAVVTYIETVERGVTRGFRKYTVTVLVLVPKQTGESDDLEAALEEVLEALDLWDYPADWTTAERATYLERYPAYKVTTEMHVRREYPEGALFTAPEKE